MYGWIDGWTSRYMYIYMYSNSNIYIDRRINIYINISIYNRIYRHRTCEYINPSIHIWTSGTPNQSPANV